jgi:hypothetical protein
MGREFNDRELVNSAGQHSFCRYCDTRPDSWSWMPIDTLPHDCAVWRYLNKELISQTAESASFCRTSNMYPSLHALSFSEDEVFWRSQSRLWIDMYDGGGCSLSFPVVTPPPSQTLQFCMNILQQRVAKGTYLLGRKIVCWLCLRWTDLKVLYVGRENWKRVSDLGISDGFLPGCQRIQHLTKDLVIEPQLVLRIRRRVK